MSSVGSCIFSDTISINIRKEYGVLLSVGKENSEAEKMLMDLYSGILNCNDPDEDVFWFALAYVEWKKGRLSDLVKSKALTAADDGLDLQRWRERGEKAYKERKKNIDMLREMILSPMPPIKKIRKPTVHHCPWREGSLLAYKIINNEKYIDSPCFNKYVLLRVLKIRKEPISTIFDTGYYNEGMIVGLYNWIGSEIPDPEIVRGLRYIPFAEFALFGDLDFDIIINSVDKYIYNGVSEEGKNRVIEGLRASSKKRKYWGEDLDWRVGRKYDNKDPFTYLRCDDDYEKDIPEEIKESIRSVYNVMLSHFTSFDIGLVILFEQYIDTKEFDYCII